MNEMYNKRGDEVLGGVILIGLAILFLTGFWWPGILFVLGIALLARSVSQGREWTTNREALVLLAVGVVFTVFRVVGAIFSSSFIWALVLIAIGLWLLFGRNGGWQRYSGSWGSRSDEVEKPKNDDLV